MSVAEIDLFAAFTQDETIKDFSKFAWVSTGKERWSLRVDKGMTYEIHVDTLGNYVARHMESKTVLGTTKDKRRVFSATDRYIYSHHSKKTGMLDSSAPWRTTPASEKQVDLIRRLARNLEIPDTLSKGDASMLIDSLMQKKRRRIAS
jgi:hypothetical protein